MEFTDGIIAKKPDIINT